MSEEIARTVVIAITAVGVVVWLTSVAVLLRATRERQARALEAAERFEIDGEPAAGTIVGEADVEGQPEDLSEKLAVLLARDGMGPLGPVKVLARDRKQVAFESSGPAFGQAAFRRGWFRLTPTGASRTRVQYAIEAPSGQVLLIIGWVVVAFGLLALLLGVWLEFTFVLPSANPAVRAQSFQMMQACHFLWPPFLFAYLSRQPARFIRGRLDALVHNLPYS
jgi:hypothetical protein